MKKALISLATVLSVCSCYAGAGLVTGTLSPVINTNSGSGGSGILTSSGFGTNTTLVNPTAIITNGGLEFAMFGSHADANVAGLFALDTTTGYGAIRGGWYHQGGGLTELWALGNSLTNSAFYNSGFLVPGSPYWEGDNGFPWGLAVSGGIVIEYLNSGYHQLNITDQATGTTNFFNFNRDSGNSVFVGTEFVGGVTINGAGGTGTFTGNGAGLTSLNIAQTMGEATVSNGSYFADIANNVVAPFSTFSAPSYKGQLLTLYAAGLGSDQAGQEAIAGDSLTWRRDRMFGRVAILNTNNGVADSLFVKGTNGQDNVITIQNQSVISFSAMRWLDMLGNEKGAIGYGNSNAAFYVKNNFLEDLGNSSGFYFASSGHIKGGLQKSTGSFVWYDGTAGTNDTTANAVFGITTNGTTFSTNTIAATNFLYGYSNANMGGGAGLPIAITSGNRSYLDSTQLNPNATLSQSNFIATRFSATAGNGGFGWSGGPQIRANNDGAFRFDNNVTQLAVFDATGFTLTSASTQFRFNGGDTGLVRGSGGIVQVTDGGAGISGFKASAIQATTALNAAIITATNGITSTISNTSVFSFTFPNTTVNWTNTNAVAICVFIDNTAVTGTSITKNGTTIFSGLSADVTIPLRAGETFSETYTVGTPVGKWGFFP